MESNPTPQEQAASSPDATAEELPFDIEEFVHAPASTARNEPAGETGGSIDASALSQLGGAQGAGRRLSRKERRAAKRALKRELKEKKAAARQAQREQRQAYRSVESQLKERDKELSSRLGDIRRRREQSKTVNDFIGYERMYQDGICELEEGVFSATLAFDDTAYHSVQDTQQQAMFANIAKLYDQFGPNATVQMAVTNTPLLREEIGSRRFFDPASQQTEEAKSDAAVFNEILNDKIREGVSNIRRTRTMTFAVSADDADDAARALSRIETQSSRIFNAMGSKAHRQNGTQRLAAIFSLLNPGKPFDFDYRRDVGRKIAATTKDYIAPATIDFKTEGRFDDCFRLDDGVWGQVLVMRRFGSELSDRALADIIDLPIPLHVT